jgi:putative flavoprotein involved in K+ transport
VDGPDVYLADGQIVRPDSMIAATGYRPDLGPIVGELGVLDDTGCPKVHGAQTVEGAPGLYFVGIDVELSGLLREIAHEAEDVARTLAGLTRSSVIGPRRLAAPVRTRRPR